MLKLSVCICLFAVVAVVLSDNFSEKKKFFHFIRAQRGSRDFKFEYVTDAGQQVNGKALAVSREEPGLYLMQGSDAPFYWVKFSDLELNNEDDFDKIVRSVKLVSGGDVLAELKDDFVSYQIHRSGHLSGGPYKPDWNLDNIGFELADPQSRVFYYVITSRNNGREHRGTTSFVNDPHVQFLSIPGRHDCYVYKAQFTDSELSRPGPMIYRNVEETLKCQVPAQAPEGPGGIKQIDQNLLRHLVG